MQRASLAWFPEFIPSQGGWDLYLDYMVKFNNIVAKFVINRAKRGSSKRSAAKLHREAMQRASLAWFPEFIPACVRCTQVTRVRIDGGVG